MEGFPHTSSILPKLPANPDGLSSSSPFVNNCLLEVRADPLVVIRGLVSKVCTMRGLEKMFTGSATPALENVSWDSCTIVREGVVLKLPLTGVRRGSRNPRITSRVSSYPPTPALHIDTFLNLRITKSYVKKVFDRSINFATTSTAEHDQRKRTNL